MPGLLQGGGFLISKTTTAKTDTGLIPVFVVVVMTFIEGLTTVEMGAVTA